MSVPFLRDFDRSKGDWVAGIRAGDRVAVYLSCARIGVNAARKALFANGCVKIVVPDRSVSEMALVKRLSGAGLTIAGRLQDAELPYEARRLGYL